jgi:hypothetical protein
VDKIEIRVAELFKDYRGAMARGFRKRPDKKKPDGQGKPSGFLNSAGTRGREGKPALGGGLELYQKAMRRADASLRPSVSRIETMMDDTAVVTNMATIRPAVRESVMYIIFVVLFSVSSLA